MSLHQLNALSKAASTTACSVAPTGMIDCMKVMAGALRNCEIVLRNCGGDYVLTHRLTCEAIAMYEGLTDSGNRIDNYGNYDETKNAKWL